MAENKEVWTWEFKCPNPKCGSSERLVQRVLDEDRAAGRVGEHVVTGASDVDEFPILDKKKKPRPGDEASVVTLWWDICAKCGTKYCFRASRRISKYSLDVSHLINKPGPGLLRDFPLGPGGVGG